MRPPYATELLKKLDSGLTAAGCAAGALISAGTRRLRPVDTRPLLVRPGGMGDLILLQVALEELGEDPRAHMWLVERRSASWARLQGLPHRCYDEGAAATLAAVAGRHRLVVNTEQRYGLAQAFARAAVTRGGRAAAFATNRGGDGPLSAWRTTRTRPTRASHSGACSRPHSSGPATTSGGCEHDSGPRRQRRWWL